MTMILKTLSFLNSKYEKSLEIVLLFQILSILISEKSKQLKHISPSL